MVKLIDPPLYSESKIKSDKNFEKISAFKVLNRVLRIARLIFFF